VKILIAEDDTVSRLKLAARLAKWGYEVVATRDGAEAWDALQQEGAPSLAILDWMMPGVDGIEICRRVRAEAREPYVYILLLTGRDRKEDLIEGLSAGADDYITKPVDLHELEVRVRGGRRIVDLQAELVASRQAMWHEATHDALTGVWNRAAALPALDRELARARREQRGVGLAIVDVDHFKRVNDNHGHAVGDLVLKEVARRMNGAVRPYDTFARYGGEEFVVVLPCCSAEEAHAVAERLRALVSASPIVAESIAITATCSIGVAACKGELSVDEMIRRADQALYAGKHAGRNRVVVYGAEAPEYTYWV
jgi:two-component system, cell cycle response regulator